MKRKPNLYPLENKVLATSVTGKKYILTHKSFNVKNNLTLYHGKAIVSGHDLTRYYCGPCVISSESIKIGYYSLNGEL